jgi:chaperonin GroEL
MKKLILKNTNETILGATQEFEDFVCSTMGPDGLNIALHNDVGAPVITKDGVTVAKVVEFEDPAKDLVAQILRQAAEKTNDEAGDGTTTSTAIASATVREGNKLRAGGYKINAIRSNVTKILHEVKDELLKLRVKFNEESDEKIQETLYKIAMISTNGDDQVSKLISHAVTKAGKSGIVNVQNGASEYGVARSAGMKIPNAGVVSYDFVQGSPDKKVNLTRCRILITDYELESAAIIQQLSEKVFQPIMDKNECLLIIAKKADKGFMANMINNNNKGHLKNACVKPPYFGAVGREMMDDVAAMCSATVIDSKQEHKLSNVTYAELGYADNVEVSPFNTVLFRPKIDEEKLAKRIEILETKAKAIGYKEKDADKTMERLSALTGRVYTIRLLSTSDIEDKERADRVEDAINACKGSVENGYLPGGGTALLSIANGLKQGDAYQKLMSDIISYPFQRILTNSGISHEVVDNELEKDHYSKVYDARNNKYGEPFDLGLIDSHKVVEKSLLNGVSVGLMLLTTTGVIADVPSTESSPYDFSDY